MSLLMDSINTSEFFGELCSRLCVTLLHSLWQFAGLAVAVVIIDRVWTARTPARSYQLHAFALTAGLCLVPITFANVGATKERVLALQPRSQNETTNAEAARVVPRELVHSNAGVGAIMLPTTTQSVAVGDQTTAPSALVPAALTAKQRFAMFSPWFAGAYLLGVIAMSLRLLQGVRYSIYLRRSATVAAEGPLLDSLRALVARWSMKATPVLAFSTEVAVPQVVGLVRSTILLPMSAMTGLSTDDLEIIIAHELAHVRRHDLWVQWLQRLAETFLFFNPSLWFLSRRISTTREYCCDDLALKSISPTDDSCPVEARYANALVQVAVCSRSANSKRRLSESETLSLAASGRTPSELRRRIARLLGEPLREPLRLSRGTLLAYVALLMMCWTGAAVWSQKTDKPLQTAAEQADVKKNDEAVAPVKPPAKKQVIVTGQIRLPDGSPAKDIVVMTATDRFGWGEGFTNGNYTKTDEKGRYRIVSKRWLPQRLFWLPNDYENNSRAVLTGGEQKPVTLKRARKIRGRVTDFEGNAVPNVWVRAYGASRTPITWAKTNEKGDFRFRPLPAGEYHLKPVRSYHDHITGQLKFYEMKTPFNSVKYDLHKEGELALAKIVAPETVSIRVNVVDAVGQPVTGEHVSIGDIGDFSNALIAEEVQDLPGTYEFQFPRGKYIRDLKLRHSWDEIAYYQEKPNVEALPAEAIVLGKANKDIEGIKVTVRPAAKLRVQLRHPNGDHFEDKTNRVSVSVKHPSSLSPSNRPTMMLQPAHFGPVKPPGLHEFRGVIPDCDVTVTVQGAEIDTVTKRVRLSENDVRTVDVILKQKTTAILRGKIVDANGKPVKKKGWLYSRGTIDNGDPNRTTGYSSTEAHVARTFSVVKPGGTVTLILYTPGYAPTWIGPLEVAARETRDDLQFVLRKGLSFPIHIRDPAGDPIAGAKILAHPVINGTADGPNHELTADTEGNFQYKHAAETTYEFKVRAPGFQELHTGELKIGSNQPLTLTMKPSPVTRGVIELADGSPAANAKVMLEVTVDSEGRTAMSGEDFGDLLATADEQGQFEIDSLSTDARYLMVVEAEDKSRVLAYDVTAGQQDLKIDIPKRRDLRIRIIGDTNLLLHRRNKPFVAVRQHVAITRDNHTASDSIGTDVYVTKTREGGLALYQGLVSGTVEVKAADQRKTVNVNEDGVTEVVFRTDQAVAGVEE